RPHQRRLPLHEGAPPDPTWRGDACAAATCLDERHPAVAPLGCPLDVGERHRLEAVLDRAELDQRGPHVPPALVAAVDDLPGAVDSEEGAQLVGEAEAV